MKVYLDSLGCPKNLVDAERMAAELESSKNILINDPLQADVVVVNTCAFVEDSKQESIDAILDYVELKKDNPNLRIVVSGCLSERYKELLKKEIPEIDSMIGVRNPQKIAEAVQTDSSTPLDTGDYKDIESDFRRLPVFSGLLSTYLKISEGCHRKCSFCAIPSIRGSLRSRTIPNIITEAQSLIDSGFQELILVAEDTTAYGLEKSPKSQEIVNLLSKLDALDSLTWIRLLYLFPNAVLLDIAEQIATSKHICHYMDIPLQHVSSKLLKRMNRPGNGKEYLHFISEIRKRVPDMAFRSAFIIGHPGETEEDVEMLINWLKKAHLNRVGFFAYSPEESTSSISQTPAVPHAIALTRIRKLADIQAKISHDLLSSYINQNLVCINEGKIVSINNLEYLTLRSQYDAPEIDGQVFIPYTDEDQLTTNFFKVRMTEVYKDYDLIGIPLSAEVE